MQFSSKGICEDYKEYGITYYSHKALVRCTESQTTGEKIKKAIYRAKVESFSAAKEFPYQKFLDTFCTPSVELGVQATLENDKYYLVLNFQTPEITEKRRFIPEEEKILRELKNKIPGSRLYHDPYENNRLYLILENGYRLSCNQLKQELEPKPESVKPNKNTNSYPRIVNITDDFVFLIETNNSEYIKVTESNYATTPDEIRQIIDMLMLKRKANETLSEEEKK